LGTLQVLVDARGELRNPVGALNVNPLLGLTDAWVHLLAAGQITNDLLYGGNYIKLEECLRVSGDVQGSSSLAMQLSACLTVA
jgi:hypothetical protein